ncbi:MAG: LysR family transcriptional regulator substrate-binding protein [Oscillospiraceae bacterium]|nr:LysR family transcriptional regulator substrate-binding protein [Oscillospiraceae bacterium]
MESKQKNLRDIIRDIKSEESGEINFGISVLRANAILPYILLPFSDMYPNVEMHFTNRRSQELIQLTLDGDLDAAIVLEPEENASAASKELNYIELPTETIYLCVSERLLSKYYGSDADTLKERSRSGADISDFQKLPFALLSNQIGEKIDECFLQAGCTPKTYTRSDSMQFTTALTVEGVAASFVINTSIFSYRSFLVPGLNFFPIVTDGKLLQQKWFLVYRKDRYLTQHIKFFFEEILRIASYIDRIPIENILRPDTCAQIIKDLRDPHFLME